MGLPDWALLIRNSMTSDLLQDVLYIPCLQGNLLSVLHMVHCSYKLHFAGNDCCILNNMGRTACTGHLCGNLYLMDIQVATSKKIHVAHLDPAPQDNDKVEFTLTAHTNMCKTILDVQHRCLSHPLININTNMNTNTNMNMNMNTNTSTNMNKNNLTPNDQGGMTTAHPSKEHALTTSLLIHQPQPQGP